MTESKFLVAPSMLASDFSCLAEELSLLEKAGADWAHWDVMDGHFVPNITFGAPVIAKAKNKSKLFCDVHLMIEHPEKYLDDFIQAGADSVTLHVESTKKLKECFEKLKEKGVKSGITLRPGTAIEEIKPYLHLVDLVLVMTVEPGFGGQSFMHDQIAKVEELHSLREQKLYLYKIQIDGGVTSTTAQLVRKADVLVAGSYILKSENYKIAIEELKNAK